MLLACKDTQSFLFTAEIKLNARLGYLIPIDFFKNSLTLHRVLPLHRQVEFGIQVNIVLLFYMKKNFFKSVCLILAAVTLFSGCENGIDDSEKQDAVVAILKTSSNDFWQQVGYSINATCEEKGITPFITFTRDEEDAQSQLDAVKSIATIKEKYNVKAIIVTPIFSENDFEVDKAVAECAGSEIPVIIIDTPVDAGKSPLKDVFKAYVGTDNVGAGEFLGAKLADLSKSDLLTARFENARSPLLRYEGFCKGIGFEADVWKANETETPSSMSAELEQHPSVTDVVFFTGKLCESVMSALDGKNVYTFDAHKEFFNSIEAGGCIKGIVAQNTFEMGRKAVQAAYDQNVSKEIYIPVIYVTADNIASAEVKPFIDYFHSGKAE